MPKPSKQRTDKARTACLQAVAILRKHPEFDEFRQHDDLMTNTNQFYTTVTADIRFVKTGQEIFRTPSGLQHDDYDWPTLVGTDTLRKAALQAAQKAKLKMTKTTRIYIAPSEKGWVEVGYQFLHSIPSEQQ